uniref:Uncharacterized protein n=1 Tax=Pseudo-nitzschia australis TaxID=44445 RepID=A0A6U9WVN9_9STRA
MTSTVTSSTNQNYSRALMCIPQNQQQQQQQQQRNDFIEGSSSSSCLELGGDGFHSPIDIGSRYGSIKIDYDSLPAMPEIQSGCSLAPEARTPSLDLLDEDLEAILISINEDNKNNICEDRTNYSYKHNWNTTRNITPNSFVESISWQDGPLSDEEIAEVIPIGDLLSDYNASEIELMKVALTEFIDTKDESSFHGHSDGYKDNDKHARMQNNFKRESFGDYIPPSPVESRVHTNTAIDCHHLWLPQVTFDEEDELEEFHLFEERLQEQQSTKTESKLLIPSSHGCQEPSDWLLQQLTQDDPSSPQYSNIKSEGGRDRVDSRNNPASKGTKHKHWSEDEDEKLKQGMEAEPDVKPTNWVDIAQNYFSNTRSATQCKNRWKNHLQPGVIRGHWQKHEDEHIKNRYSQGYKWLDISKGLVGRTSEHVRERFVNVLDCNLKKTGWTAEEDRILFESQRRFGNKWSQIRKLLPGRSDNMIKNRYYNKRNSHLRRLKRDASRNTYSSLV